MTAVRAPAGAIAASLGLFLAGVAAAGATPDARDRTWFATAYYGRYIASNLVDVPRNVLTGRATFEDVDFVSASLSRVLVPDIRTDVTGLQWALDGSSLEFEAQFGRHFGHQTHGEITVAMLWRSPDVSLPGHGTVNFAVGEGLSWATSKPKFEGAHKGAESHKFLNYLAFEAELSHPSAPGLALVPRLHHRSGVFGVIAPRSTGSNFLGVGLRFDLQ